MAFSQSWLEDPAAIRGILVEVVVYDIAAVQNITLYLSSIGYITTDSLTSYTPCVSGGIQIAESLALDGSISISFGDIGIHNATGDFDIWLDNTKYIWYNKAIQVYIGDPSWICTDILQVHTDFLKVFDGVVVDIDANSRDTVNIKVADKLQRLNTPLTEHTLGTYGTWASGQTNQDSVLPLVFGEVFNITPMLIDPSTLEYSFNDGKSEQLIELRDNGVPIYNSNLPGGAIVDLALGKFKLTHALVGTLTASIQGVVGSINITSESSVITNTTYTNSIGSIITFITTQYGINKLSTAELDLPNLLSFYSSNAVPIGYAVLDRANILSVCQEILSSIGAQLYITRLGKLQILQIGVPTSDPIVYITERDMLLRSLSISSRTSVTAAFKLGYCKNWTNQPGLVTNIPEEHKTSMSTEWLSETLSEPTVAANYSLSSVPIQKDTFLIHTTDADVEANRLLNFYKVPRTVYKLVGTAKLLSLKLGQSVNITSSRFGLSTGKVGQVISLIPNWTASTIDIEILI